MIDQFQIMANPNELFSLSLVLLKIIVETPNPIECEEDIKNSFLKDLNCTCHVFTLGRSGFLTMCRYF